ncbi:MAG: hypothetical protein K2W96_13540 [Gemmataceae bacterium]|nr:hypothetical protein [Gemmataceae bacterium]
MKQRTLLALACAALAGSSATAYALMIALPPAPTRVATATAAYVGKVTEVADKAVKAEMFKGDERELKIAKVKVTETILGKGAREVKVGYFVPMPIRGGGRPIRPGLGRGMGPQLSKDMEGVFMLHKHPTMKDVYVFADFQGFVQKTGNPGFDGELKTMKETAKLLADPMKGLKSKDAAERLKTASLLVSRYRTQPPGEAPKTEDVPAEQTKLILGVIADSDWNARGGRFGEPNAQQMFYQLGLTPKDGWEQPRDFTKTQEAAKKWLKDNAEKYKMKRFVRDEGGPSEEPGAPAK